MGKFLIPRTYTCLFDGANFVGQKLTPEAQKELARHDEYLDMTFYKNETFDYTIHEVRVCPKCHFASSDDLYFNTVSAYTRAIELDYDIADAINNTYKERQKIAAESHMSGARGATMVRSTTLYGAYRTTKDGLASFELALACSDTIYNLDPKRYPRELERIMEYCLKAYSIAADDQKQTWLERSVSYCDLVMQSRLKGDVILKLLYQSIVIAKIANEDKKAQDLFDELKNKSESASIGGLSNFYILKAQKILSEY